MLQGFLNMVHDFLRAVYIQVTVQVQGCLQVMLCTPGSTV